MLVSSISVMASVNVVAEETTEQIVYWNGEKVKPTQGTGTQADPYRITTPMELAWAVEQYDESLSVYSRLENDIYINDVSSDNWYTASDVS